MLRKSNTEFKVLIHQFKEVQTSLNFDSALTLLEKLHILAQPDALPHFYVHFLMLKLAIKFKIYKEVLGQIPRLILAIPGSLLGLAPKRNVGSTKMGIF